MYHIWHIYWIYLLDICCDVVGTETTCGGGGYYAYMMVLVMSMLLSLKYGHWFN